MAYYIYYNLLSLQDIEDDTFELACNRYMKIMEELSGAAEFSRITILRRLVIRFLSKVQYKKQLGMDIVQTNNENITEAIQMFEDVDHNDTLGTIHSLHMCKKKS